MGLKSIGVGLGGLINGAAPQQGQRFCLASLNCNERSSAVEFVIYKRTIILLRAYFVTNVHNAASQRTSSRIRALQTGANTFYGVCTAT
jgi:hypothetical protein